MVPPVLASIMPLPPLVDTVAPLKFNVEASQCTP